MIPAGGARHKQRVGPLARGQGGWHNGGMSYLVLARKWRPRRFSELVGQEHVVRALSNALETGKVHHAFLFTGTRGVGKTTIARIFAKSLNCERGTSAEPCGECAACRDIDAGRYVDLLEIDAASNTGVDDVRELIDNAQYMPSRGKFKVYLIDEVHMLSKAAFNALLKTLEEPPEHVKFLLATTDPQKLPVTVLSRCLQFNLRRLELGQISGQMQRILEAEGIASEPAAIELLARAADGSLRDGLSLLDQAIAYTGGQLGEEAVNAMLGTVDRAQVGLVRQQVFDHGGTATAGGFQPRRARQGIARFQVGAGGQQDVDDVDMPGQGGFVQGAAALAVACVGAGLVLEQQLHAGRIVVLGGGGRQQHGSAFAGFAARTAFEQEAGQAPVADLAGHRQRRPAGALPRPDQGAVGGAGPEGDPRRRGQPRLR